MEDPLASRPPQARAGSLRGGRPHVAPPDAGARAVVQPGGSVRDEEVVAAAAAAGVPLYLTGTRHFAH